MANDQKPPSALKDLTAGLGLLFRAAKTTLQKLPTGELEEAVITSAKEVGRAIENVTQTVTHTVSQTVEKQIFRRPSEARRAEDEAAPQEPASADREGGVRVEASAEPPPKDPPRAGS